MSEEVQVVLQKYWQGRQPGTQLSVTPGVADALVNRLRLAQFVQQVAARRKRKAEDKS